MENIKRILVAEDDEINQEVIKILLEGEDFVVEVVSNGKEVLAALARNDYQLILMDVQMPQLDGYEATKMIRQKEQEENRSPIPIIAVTAYATEEDRNKLYSAGVSDYLSKPLHMDQLMDSVRNFL